MSTRRVRKDFYLKLVADALMWNSTWEMRPHAQMCFEELETDEKIEVFEKCLKRYRDMPAVETLAHHEDIIKLFAHMIKKALPGLKTVLANMDDVAPASTYTLEQMTRHKEEMDGASSARAQIHH